MGYVGRAMCRCVSFYVCVDRSTAGTKILTETSKNAITGPPPFTDRALLIRSLVFPGEFMISKARPREIEETFCLPGHTVFSSRERMAFFSLARCFSAV